MLAKKDRLPLNQLPDFFPESQKFFTAQLTFFYQKNPDTSAQISIIIPKKAVPLATRRNYLKRLIAAQVQPLLTDFSGYQVAIVAKAPGAQHPTTRSIQLTLQKFLAHLSQRR